MLHHFSHTYTSSTTGVHMATVYIWGTFNLTDHAAIKADGAYFSFHPKDSSLKAAPNDIVGSVPTLKDWEEDFAQYGPPIATIEILGLNEVAMGDKLYEIAKEMDLGIAKYSLFGRNCSTVVAEALYAGAGSSLCPFKGLPQIWAEWTARRPYGIASMSARDRGAHVTEFARDMTENMFLLFRRGTMKHPLHQSIAAIFGTADLASRAFCWTPDGVRVLAENFAKNNP
jgi:hypothetical protein